MKFFRFILLVLLTFPCGNIFSQQLFFCENYSVAGIPENISNRWNIYESGGMIYFFYDHEAPFNQDKIFFYIDHKIGGSFKEFDVREVEVGKSETWKVVDYKITEEGTYKVTVLDSGKNKLTAEEITVSLQERKITPDYFQNSKVLFCSSIEGDIPIDTLTKIKFSAEGEAEAIAVLELDKPLKTFRITVDIWTLSGGRLGEFIESQFMDANPDERSGQLKYYFPLPGNYRFMFYSDEQVYMGSGTLLVEEN